MVTLVNLTPHDVAIDTAGGPIHLKPTKSPARVKLVVTTLAPVHVGDLEVSIVNERVESPAGLPDPVEDTFYVVSRLVAESSPHRHDLLVPTQLIRANDGSVSAARALARIGVPRATGAASSPEAAEGTLVVLCGSNPLPLFLAIATRRPPAVVLVHTRETRPHMKRLIAALNALTEPIPHTTIELSDAGNAASIRKTLSALGTGWELDYTGGTKAMAAHARLALESVRLDADQVASYVDHSRNVLRFDDGRRLSLRTTALTLRSLAALHGGELTMDGGRERPDEKWLLSFADSVVRSMGRAQGAAAKKAAYGLKTRELRLLAAPPSWRTQLANVPGGWLEWFVEDRVRRALNTQPRNQHEVVIGSHFRPDRADDDAELDVLARVGWRVTLLSCDTSLSASRWTAEHKKKAMESVARARQIGGDAARAAFVTLLEPAGVEAVRRHLPPVELNAPAVVFGRLDLQRWLNDDLSDLTDWCTR